jgi:hypothetical protein
MSGGGGQEPLELAELDTSRPVGRVEAAIRRSVKAAHLAAEDEGAAEAAAMLGRGMDLAATVRRDPYAVAAVGKPLMEQLARLGMDPEARRNPEEKPSGGDAWDQLLDELGDELRRDKGGQRDHHRPGTSAH